MKTASEIISLWPTAAELGRDIGVDPGAVRNWCLKERGTIPSKHHAAIVAAARARDLAVTYEMLAMVNARETAA